jgi:hypothetical protein
MNMNTPSALFLGERKQVAFIKGSALWVSNEDSNPYFVGEVYSRRSVISNLNNPRLLSCCPFGIYLAFWDFNGESFRLVDITGTQFWSVWMNSDKALPRNIRFAVSGDALACEYDFEGAPGLFFCDINKRQATTFGCSNSPIGYDSGLRYFVIDKCDPYEDKKLPFYIRDVGSNAVISLSSDKVKEMIKENPIILNRDRFVMPAPFITERGWDAISVQGDLNDIVLLKNGDLYWIVRSATSLVNFTEYEIPQFLTDDERSSWGRPMISILGDEVLLQSDSCGKVKVCSRYRGIQWEGSSCSSVILRYKHVITRYSDGTVGIFQISTKREQKYKSVPGFETIAADFIGGHLAIAYLSLSGDLVRIDMHDPNWAF